MGSGNSRLNAAEGGDVLPPKARSTLLNRFEEFRRRRNGGGTLSKKQLLKDAEDTEDENSQISHESETEDNKVLVLKETQPIKEEMVVKEIAIEKISRVVPIHNPESEIVEQKDQVNQNIDSNKDKTEQVEHVNECIDHNRGNMKQFIEHLFNVDNKDQGVILIDPKQGNVTLVDEKAEAEVKTGEGKIAEKAETEVKTEEGKIAEPVEEPKRETKEEVGAESDDDSDDDDEEDEDEDLDRFLYPGSPSFRIYYIEAEKRKDQEECNSPTIVMHHQKSHSADSVASSASRKSIRNSKDVLEEVLDVEIEPIAKGKGKKSKKFGPMRKLLKVKSCYYPMSTCTGNDRAHLIAAKAAH